MDDRILQNRLTRPVVTGTPGTAPQKPHKPEDEPQGQPFRELLQQQMAGRQSIQFSKHAASRIQERSIEITPGSMERLQEGMALARQKGLDDTLILVDRTAFIVSAKNGTIITALGEGDLKGNVITNITGTVII